MKITEIIWEDGKQYKDEFGNILTVRSSDLYDKQGTCITYIHSLESISIIELEEVIDWSKVEVDTPIWVKYEDGSYEPRHFAKYENGKVYYWPHGKTKHTTGCFVYVYGYDKQCYLTKPKED